MVNITNSTKENPNSLKRKKYSLPYQDKTATNIRFGNRLADGNTISYKSISAIVPAGH